VPRRVHPFGADRGAGGGLSLQRKGMSLSLCIAMLRSVEFGTSSISSPGMESYLSMLAPADVASALVEQNDELLWADTSQRGYMMVELTPTTATSEWRFMAGIKERSTKLAATKRASVAAGAKRQGA
ncbi:MAG: alkaline phosphatase D family protein, partial [Pseudomonadota bacterium]